MVQKKKIFILLILIISFLAIFSNTAMAIDDPITNPDAYKPGDIGDGDIDVVTSKAGIVFDVITTVGIVTAVITLLIIGIKYMIGSVEEKAEYKKTMIPYIIGIVMIGGISVILRLISNVVANIQ